jgi:DNA-binding NtrC family response regulator
MFGLKSPTGAYCGGAVQTKVLIVDDDREILLALESRLRWMGHDTLTAETGEKALALIAQEVPDLVLLDIELPGMSGLDALKRLADRASRGSGPGVIVLTAHGTVARAVEAMQLGAIDFIMKPFEPEHLAMVIQKAVGIVALQRQMTLLRSEVEGRYEHIIGNSTAMVSVVSMAKRVAPSSVTVLILGETGTGKEVIARALHRWSARSLKPFVVVNCAALSEHLLENELFGHEKGSYTGADTREVGKIESADGGTVFLDEIGEMPLAVQSRLLRVLQDNQFYRVGGSRLIRSDVRFVAATNKSLSQEVKRGTFREDLYYRLDVVTLKLPPLRDRKEDLPLLVEHFLEHAKVGTGDRQAIVDEAVWSMMNRYRWPGNVRELENVLIRAMILSQGTAIRPEHLQLTWWEDQSNGGERLSTPPTQYHDGVERYGRKLIEEALRRNNWNQTKAARELGLLRTSLTRLLRQKDISGKPPEP